MSSDNLEFCNKNNLNLVLPQVVNTTVNGKTLYHKIRKVPCVIRMKRYSLVSETHEFYFSELTKFKPHRSETELFPKSEDFALCEALYFVVNHSVTSGFKETFGESQIEEVKIVLMPNYKATDKLREMINNINIDLALNDIEDPSNIDFDFVNSDSDEEFEGLKGLHPDESDHQCKEQSKRIPIFNSVEIKHYSVLVSNAAKLSYDQFFAFQKILDYCFQLKVSRKNSCLPRPTPPRIILEGGAGSGKSYTINTIRDWINYLLFDPGDNIDQPYLLVAAPTGMAATNVNGSTIHSTFKFSFGNTFRRLGDANRDKIIDAYKNVQFIIIDEVSMISSDMLFNISKRLSEIKCCDDFFGGCAIILVGDFMQLRPIDNNYIFETPTSKTHKDFFIQYPLLHTFEVVCLQQNHRQEQDNNFLSLLNEIRMKAAEDQLTPENTNLLLSRVQPLPHNEFACKIFAKNETCKLENEKQLNALPGNKFTSEARFIPETYIPKIKSGGTIDDTPFIKILELKPGARVILKYNINVEDRLVNGSQGTIFEITHENGCIKILFIEFDDPTAGREHRNKFRHLSVVRENPNIVQKWSFSTSHP